MSGNNRNISLDAVGGLFIILMMFQHYNIVTRAPYTIGHFFMYNTIWFFFKSGMYHKPTELNRQTLKKWSKKLLVPFCVCAFWGISVCFLCEGIITSNWNWKIFYGGISQIAHIGSLWWNIPIWFLLTLFFVKLLTANYTEKYSWIYIVSGLTVAYLHHYFIIDDFNYIGTTGMALVFYVLGIKSNKIRFGKRWMIIVLIIMAAILFVVFPVSFEIFDNKTRYGNYFWGVAMAYAGIILINEIFAMCKWLHIKPLVFMGRNSMVFLVFHVPFFLAFMRFAGEENSCDIIYQWIAAIFSICCCMLIYVLLDRIPNLKWIIGR